MKKSFLLLLLIGVVMACTDTEKNPTILSVEPNAGKYNDLVTITATDFDANAQNLIVTFSGVHAEIVSVTGSTIVVKVPPSSKTGKVGLISNDQLAESASDFTVQVGQWKRVIPDSPFAGRSDNAEAFVVDGKAYLFFGQANYNGATENAQFWLFDHNAYTWTNKTPYSVSAILSGTVSFGSSSGKGYVLESWTSTGVLHVYDVGTNTWSEKPGPYTGDNATAAPLAAFNINDDGFVLLSNKVVLRYDGDWWQKTTYPGQIQNGQAHALAIGNKFYILSGTTFWEYNIGNDTWTQRADAPAVFPTAFVQGSKIYGGDFSTALRTTNEYDPAKNTWVQEASFEGSTVEYPVAFSVGGAAFAGMGVDKLKTEPRKDFYEFFPFN